VAVRGVGCLSRGRCTRSWAARHTLLPRRRSCHRADARMSRHYASARGRESGGRDATPHGGAVPGLRREGAGLRRGGCGHDRRRHLRLGNQSRFALGPGPDSIGASGGRTSTIYRGISTRRPALLRAPPPYCSADTRLLSQAHAHAARTADQPADASQRAASRQLVAKAFCRETEGRLRDN
jgi:hypothetical protein